MAIISIGLSPVQVAIQNIKRAEIFIQNEGEEKIFFTKQKNGVVRNPSESDHDFMLVPIREAGQSGNIKEASCVSRIKIKSIGGIKAISEGKGSLISTFETEEVVL